MENMMEQANKADEIMKDQEEEVKEEEESESPKDSENLVSNELLQEKIE